MGLAGTSSNTSNVIRSQLPKDQPLPQPLATAVDDFKYFFLYFFILIINFFLISYDFENRNYLEEIKKTKELNLSYNNKDLNQNIQEISKIKQKLTHSKTELQRNYNECSKLKNHVTQVNKKILIFKNLNNIYYFIF